MHITGFIRKKLKSLRFSVPVFSLLFIVLFSSCGQKDNLELARESAGKSEIYYQHAVERYKALIKRSGSEDLLYLELARLYYSHGEFDKVISLLKDSDNPGGLKLLALSYYNLGRFTEALEIFNRQKSLDDEYLYYKGLTCEKLNLFDQALAGYAEIKGAQFKEKASMRIGRIEKQAGRLNIKEVEPKINDILKNAPDSREYPQAGALVLYCNEKVVISEDNTETTTAHYLIKILNERGKESFSEAHIEYDSTFEKVDLEYARTILPDGRIVEVGSRHIRDVSKYLNFPLYSNARVLIISFPEITNGAAIEYKAKISRNQLINKGDFVMSYPVQSTEPIISAEFTVGVPSDKKLNIKVINEEYNQFGAVLKPNIQRQDKRILYSWHFKNIPQVVPEIKMPPMVEINPVILLSTFESWRGVYDWWWGLAKDKIEADFSIRAKVKGLISGLKTDKDKIRAIYDFCAQEIRYVAVEYGQAGYEPHKASDIFRNKYGDCKDQAVLLVTMLREAGFSAFPVLIATKSYYDLNDDLPATLFNHSIAVVYLDGKFIFMDPTAETCSFGDLPAGDQGRKVVVFKDKEYSILTTPLFTPEHNLARQQIEIRVDNKEAIRAKKQVLTTGYYDQMQRYWLLYTQPELIQEMLNQRIQEISIGAELKRYDIANLDKLDSPVMLEYTFSGPEYFTAAGDLRIMPQLANLDTSSIAKDKRKYPLEFGVLSREENIFEIEIPNNYVIKYMPDNVSRNTEWFDFNVDYLQKGKKVYFKQRSEIKKASISREEYAEFKRTLENLAKMIKQRIVLEKSN